MSSTIMPDSILLDKNLTSDAKVLLWYMLSKPEGYEMVYRDVMESLNCKEYAVIQAIKTLEAAGYVFRLKIPNGTKGFKWETKFFADPADCEDWKASHPEKIRAALAGSTGKRVAKAQ